MRYLILIMILSGCGRSEVTTGVPFFNRLPDSACQVINKCTYAKVPGYVCESLRYDSYDQATCVIKSQDFEFDPRCDINHPTETCTIGGWGSPLATFTCCQVVQGPGPAVE